MSASSRWAVPASLDADWPAAAPRTRPPPKPRPACRTGCGATIDRRNTSGYCRACYRALPFATKHALTAERPVAPAVLSELRTRIRSASGAPVPVPPDLLDRLITIAEESARDRQYPPLPHR